VSRSTKRATRRSAIGRSTRALALALAGWLSLAGCGGPVLWLPGGELSGEVAREIPDDWSFLSDPFVDLETRPSDPYSVELNYTVRDGRLYIDPAEGRRWLDFIREDPRVRVRFDGVIYPLVAVPVDDPSEREGFPADRFIYRLEPRPPTP
jgi:hypothetical protein